MEAEGGIVFYVDETGLHGLVAGFEDIGSYQWGCQMTEIIGANGTVIGSGYQNTIDIVNSNCMLIDFISEELIDGTTVLVYSEPYDGQTAAGASFEYQLDGYDDWYLPSNNELYEMYSSIGQGSPNGNIGGFSNSNYWASSETNLNGSWFVDFNSGLNYHSVKSNAFWVRPTRSF